MINISEPSIKTKRYSYTALSQYENCPYSFWQKYVLHHYPIEDTLPLSLGSLLHKCRELVSLELMAGRMPNYELIEYTARCVGWKEADKANPNKVEELLPIDVLKLKFFEDWLKPDDNGLTYDQKVKTFFEHLNDEEKDPEWITVAVEMPFDFEVRPGINIRGFIDKVQQNKSGEYRIVDYKTSKKVYDESKIKTPLQLYIYHLALSQKFPDAKIVEYMYDFVLLNQTQLGGTLGWLKRADKKLNKLLDGIAECEQSGEWKPKPSPLCYWCSYCVNNPKADKQFNINCPYFSFWTPDDRHNFSTNMTYMPGEAANAQQVVEEKKAMQEFRW